IVSMLNKPLLFVYGNHNFSGFKYFKKDVNNLSSDFFEIEKFIENLLKSSGQLKTHKISEEEIGEIILKISSQNLFGEKFLYWCPLIEKNRQKKEFLDGLLQVYQKKEMVHFFVFGILEEAPHPLWKVLKENHRFYSFESIKYDKEWSQMAEEIIEETLQKNKKSLSYEAKILLKERCKGEPFKLKKELEKICLYSSKEKIEADIIRKMCDEESSETFGIKKALEKRDAKLLLDQIKKLLKEGEPPILILSIISKEIKFLILLKSIIKRKDTVLKRDEFIQKVFPYIKNNLEKIEMLEENYASRFKNPNALYFSYEALLNYELEELIEMQEKLKDFNLNIRIGFEPESLLYNFCFDIIKKRKEERDGI
ncbi:MAG: hypothetical protein WHV67_03310, partial [Thermoanaerobaculia bacterium]